MPTDVEELAPEALPAEETQPDTVEDADTPPEFGKNNRELPESLKNALGALVKEFQGRDLYDRRIEVLNDRILRLYDDGVQHVYPNYGTGVYQIGVAGGVVDLGNGDQVECPEYMGAYNIFRARRRGIDAVLTQNPPGVDFRPDHPDKDEDMQAAKTAEGYRHLFDQSNDVRRLQQDVARMFELSGRCVTWTHTEANQKWGYNEQGQPRSMEVCEVFGTLESKVPIVCESQEKALYVFLYRDPDVLIAKARNQWIRDKIVPGEAGLGESDWERYARLGIRQTRKGYFLTGSALAHVVTEMHCFLRPAAFESKSCDGAYLEADDGDVRADGGVFTLRDKLNQLYPEGAHAVWIGKEYSESWAEAMDDAIDIAFPCERDSLTGGALLEPMKVVQDGFNDFKNAEREYYEKGWPVTWFKGSQEDYDAFVNQRSAPAQFALLKEAGGPDVPIENYFHREAEMVISPTFVECMENYRGPLSQDVTGALPALVGETDPGNKTATGKAIDRSQAMGMLGPPWANLQRLFAGIYKKAALAASNNPDHAEEITVVSGQGQTISVRLEKLKRGSFHCHPDVDSTFPESTAAKRAQLAQMLPLAAQTPVGMALFQSPDNWEQILELQGFPELVLTPALAYQKQTRELDVLLREQPVPNTAAVAQAQVEHAQLALQARAAGLPEPPFEPPPPELPSLQPGKRDYHDWELKKCQEYLSGEDCWRRENVGDGSPAQSLVDGQQPAQNPMPGYSSNPYIRNVQLHADMHEMFLKQQAAAMMPPAPPAPAPPPAKPKPAAAAAAAPGAPAQVQQGAAPPGAPGQPTL